MPSREPVDSAPHRFLLLFVDGVGLAPTAPSNPLSAAPMSAVRDVLGGPLTAETTARHGGSPRPGLCLRPVDACLGVDGLPQSATGQTSLFTGVNAAAHMGRHVTAFPGPQLRALLAEHSVFRLAVQAGHEVTFANPFGPAYFTAIAERRRRGHSASTWAILAAGLGRGEEADVEALEGLGAPDRAPDFLRGLDELSAGRAVPWDITRAHFRAVEPGADLEELAPQEAGRHLALVAGDHDLTLYETFLTDLAGHRRWNLDPEEVLSRIDGLVHGLLAHRPANLTVVLSSDHGNIEDTTHKRHTRNPVPLLAIGPAAHHFASASAITDVAPLILETLRSSGGGTTLDLDADPEPATPAPRGPALPNPATSRR